MHSRQAYKFALYRTQTPNRGNYRGKVLAFVTSQIRDSEGYILLIRRHCTGYVAYSTLYLTLYPSLYRSTVPNERSAGIHARNPIHRAMHRAIGIGQKNTRYGGYRIGRVVNDV